MFRKRIATALALVSLLALTSAAPLSAAEPASTAGPVVEPLSLTDCGLPEHWAAPFACDLQHHGFTAPKEFDVTLTRGDFAALLAQATATPGAPVTDADQPIRREDAMRMVMEAVAAEQLKDVDLRVLENVPDADQISADAKNAIAFAMLHGVVQGRLDRSLDPQGPLTQGAAVKMIALAVPEALPAGTAKVTIVSYNDFHGHLIQDSKKRAGRDLGAPVLTTAINGQRLKQPNLVLLDGGDTFQGTPISNLVKGDSVQEWRNYLGVTAATLGNHEFDWSRETMLGLIKASDFPVVSANIFLAGEDERPDWITPSAMVMAGDFEIGVIGITTPQTKVTTLPANVADLEFRDPAPVIDEQAKKLRADGADLVFVMIHDVTSPGSTDPAVVQGETAAYLKDVTERIDAVIGGHSHDKTAGYVVNAKGEKVPAVQAGSYGQALGRIELYIDRATGALTRAVPFYFAPEPTLAPNPAVSEILAKWNEKVKPIQEQTVGKLAQTLSRTTTDAGESALGDFISDAMLTALPGLDISLMNGGGIRADVEPAAGTGEVTWGQWYTVQPFGNTMVVADMTGAEVKASLEEGVDNYVKLKKNEKGGAKPLQVAGIHFAWDFAKPFGERVTSVTLPDGTPLDLAKSYKVVVNNFMATGGDNFVTLGGLNKAGKTLDLGVVDLDVTVDYFKALAEQGAVEYGLQNRITVTNFPAE